MAIIKDNFLTAGLNQFAMTSVRGMLSDWGLNAQVMEVEISDEVQSPVLPGDAVKLVSSPKGIPTVDLAAGTDAIYGMVIWNTKSTTGLAGKRVVVLRDGGVMMMITDETITAGTPVYYDAADGGVTATNPGAATPIGIALEDTEANANGVLFRVEVVKQPLAK